MEHIIGIDVGGTAIKWGRADSSGVIVERGKIPTERERPHDVPLKVAQIVKEHPSVAHIGLSFPGMVRPDGSLATSGAIVGLEGFPLRNEIEKLTGLPTTVLNDAHSAGLAERWTGAGKDSEHFVCMTIGTGIGGAVIANGRLYRGFMGAAGELSFVLLGRGMSPAEVSEAIAAKSGAGIYGLARNYSEAIGITDPTQWFTDTWEILRLAESDDPDANPAHVLAAQQATATLFDSLTSLMVNVMVILNPERILLGGGVSERPGFVDKLRQHFQTKVSNHEFLHQDYVPEVLPCLHGNDASILGAIYAAHTGQ